MRKQLLLVIVGIVALVIAVHDIPLAGHLERVERDRLVTKLERDAFILAGRSEEALENGDANRRPALRAIVARYNAEEEVRVVIVNSDGIGVVASDQAALGQSFLNRQEITTALTGAPTTGERYSNTLGEELFYVAVPALSGDKTIGAVRLTAPERIVSSRAAERTRGVFVVAGISLLIAVAAAWLLARRLSRPILELQRTTHRLAAGDLSARADPNVSPAEVSDLASSFNTMAGQLHQLIDRQRAFAGTASHQLRTPLTALRLRIEQIATRVDQSDDVMVNAIDSALAETDRLHRMIEGLLALSRAEDAAAGATEVDLAAIARDRVAHWQPLAAEHDVHLSIQAPSSIKAMSVVGASEQIIDNLVDNALEVSPPGSQISITVRPGDKHVELHIVDQGPGLTEAEREAAFVRFWRGEDATPGGSGLGLAIVRQLARAGGGDAELSEAPSGGLAVLVTFPRVG